jgi:hypothetical protein
MNIPESYKINILSGLDRLDLDDIWKLKGNVQVLKNYILQNATTKDDKVIRNIDSLLGATNELYTFLSSVKGSVSAADFNKLARVLHTGGETISAIEEIITEEDIKLPELLMTGISMVITYAGDTAYITSALESCESHVGASCISVYDRYWNLIHDYYKEVSPKDIDSINKSMTAFFKKLSNKDIVLSERITIVTRMYQFLCMVYLAGIIRNIEWVKSDSLEA